MESVIAGVLLCGGRSTRMGQDKSGLLLDGRTFLQHCCQQFDRFRYWCAVGAKGASKPNGFGAGVWLTDQVSDRGPLEGIAVGLNWVAERAEWAWVSAVDAPFISHSLVTELSRIACSEPEFDVVIPRVGEQVFPLTAVYRSSLAPRVRGLVDEGWRRVSDLPQQFRARFVDEEELRIFDSELLSLTPVNSPDQYRAYLERLSQNRSPNC
ncbi:MAG: molybdenum cofactor guanylyltransferase [Pirellulaceae bacterium]|nr:molybdenum cofactor guanylyltransferase [Pirellulaceae bacterium]